MQTEARQAWLGERLGRVSLIGLVTASLALLLAGCGAPAAPAQSDQGDVLNVLVSIAPQRYFVERIGGDRVHVGVMVPSGSNPSTYEPKPSQIEGLGHADMYVRIRVPFEESWMSRFAAANTEMLIVDETEGIERIGGTDPHIWLSPRLVKVQAQTIYEGLAELDGQHAEFYAANLSVFLADIDRLDASTTSTLANLESRKFMVFHPAWSYFARDYDLEMIPVEVEGSEPSASEMARLIQVARANEIRVIFAQPQFSTRSAEAIASEIGGEVVLIDPLAPDWMDNLRNVADTLARVLGTNKEQ
jgi:zinc transport system substrate-binding protein